MDKAIGCTEDEELRTVNSFYPKLLLKYMGDIGVAKKKLINRYFSEEAGKQLKERTVFVFEEICETKLLMMMFHLSDLLGEDLEMLGSAIFLASFGYDHITVIFMRACRRISVRRTSRMS